MFSIVTGAPFNVSFVNTLPPVDGMVSSLAKIVPPTTTVAVAKSQLAGVTFNPVVGSASHSWYVIVYVPVGVFASNVNTPFKSILNGPVVVGVTLVLVVVTAIPFNVSFAVTLPTVVITVDAGTL